MGICTSKTNHDLKIHSQWDPKPPKRYDASTILVAYIRDDVICDIPDDIFNLMLSYISFSHKIYGIGKPKHKKNEWGTYTKEAGSAKYYNLEEMSTICSDTASNIYYGFNRYIIKTVNNKLYTIGHNKFTDLGIGDHKHTVIDYNKLSFESLLRTDKKHESTSKFQEIAINLDNNDKIDIIGNGFSSFTILITTKSKIYAWGENMQKFFGNDVYNDHAPVPTYFKSLNSSSIAMMNNKNKIIKIAQSQKHILFLDINGNVYSCGDNSKCQCGLQNDLKDDHDIDDINTRKIITQPTLIELYDVNIIDIEVCNHCSYCLSDDNKLWFFGSKYFGHLYKYPQKYFLPILYPFFKVNNIQIVIIKCGLGHTVCVDINKRCFMFGDNQFGQIDPKSRQSEIEPRLFFNYITNVWCGSNHTILLQLGIYIKFGDRDNWNISKHIYEDRIRLFNDNVEIERIIATCGQTLIITSNKS